MAALLSWFAFTSKHNWEINAYYCHNSTHQIHNEKSLNKRNNDATSSECFRPQIQPSSSQARKWIITELNTCGSAKRRLCWKHNSKAQKLTFQFVTNDTSCLVYRNANPHARRNSYRPENTAQVGTGDKYCQMCMYKQGSPAETQTPTQCNRIGRKYDPPAACVIAQQYSSATFVTPFFHTGACQIYCYFISFNCAGLKLRNLIVPKSASVSTNGLFSSNYELPTISKRGMSGVGRGGGGQNINSRSNWRGKAIT